MLIQSPDVNFSCNLRLFFTPDSAFPHQNRSDKGIVSKNSVLNGFQWIYFVIKIKFQQKLPFCFRFSHDITPSTGWKELRISPSNIIFELITNYPLLIDQSRQKHDKTYFFRTLIDFCSFLRKSLIAARTRLDPAHEHYFR